MQASDAVNTYGLIEKIKVFEDIYPNRIGTVTSIDNDSELVFFDNTMFNLNEKDGSGNTKWLIAGTTAKVHFNTGACAGYDFDISEFTYKSGNTVIGKFKINALKDENNYIFPSHDNNAFRIAVGDEYIITDIVLPTSYITAAQNALQTAAADWYNKHCAPAVEYTMTLSQQFVKRLAAEMGIVDGVVFNIGDKITVTDTALGFTQKQFRIVQFSRDLTKEYAYTLKISETNLHRAQYRFRRRTYVIPDIIRRFRLDEPAQLAAEANQVAVAYRAFGLGTEGVAMGNANATRIGYIIDNSNHLRASVIANNTLTQAMLVADLAQRIANVQILERFINNGSFSDRRFNGTADFTAEKLTMKDFVLHDAYTRAKLNHPVSQWELAAETVFDFENGTYDDNSAYHVYAKVEADGTLNYEIIKDGEEADIVSEQHVKIGTVSAKGGDGRTFERCIGQAYVEDGQLKDGGGTTILDIINGYIEGATKIRRNNATTYSLTDEIVSARTLRKFFAGSETGNITLKDADNNDTDLQTILGILPGYGLRYDVGDLIDKVGEDAQDVGGLLYRAAQLESRANTHFGKVNELIDSIYSANQVLVSIQNKFNSVLGKLQSHSIITQAEEETLTLGIQQCTWNPLQQQEQCGASPTTIGVPTRLQN